jgi:nucleotide-binding universal stress UspA family protein
MIDLKNLLVGLTQESHEAEVSSALAYGLSLAQAAGAHLTIQAASLKLILTSSFVGHFATELVAAENRRLHRLAQMAAEEGRQNATASGVTCIAETRELPYPDLLDAFTAQARVHDLTVLDAEPVALALDRDLIEAVLTQSGRPLIVVPLGHDRFRAARIVVAWDGSARAARAVNDAMPLLKKAGSVDVVSVEGEKDLSGMVAGANLARHLVRHGIDVEVTTLRAENGDVAETLRRHATLYQADLLVMGAFVHSRVRQMVLGGVTQSLLKHCDVPLLLSY